MPYRSLSVPIQVGFGKQNSINLNNSLEVTVGVEPVYPLSNYSADNVHLLFSGGLLFTHRHKKEIKHKRYSAIPKSSLFIKYSKSVGLSSIRSAIQLGVLIGLGYGKL